MSSDPIVIVAAKRTPMGSMQGCLSSVAAPMLGANAISAAVNQCGIDKTQIDASFMGCVLQAGLGQAPARQAALQAGLSEHCAATTINKMCGSGMQAVILAHDLILAGTHEIAVCGGFENMSSAPYLLPKARGGYRLGHDTVYDHMFLDGLEDAYERGTLMGVYAEQTAKHYGFSRENQDEFAIESLKRAQAAASSGAFDDEISAVTIKARKGDITVDADEQPQKGNPDKIPTLKPAFAKDGTVTAANASSISDGASSLIIMRQSKAQQLNMQPLAVIHAHSVHAQAPNWFTTAPVNAMRHVLDKANWQIGDVDLFEINEAFAVVTLAAIKELELNPDMVNIHGGACALGHPIGASGARIITTLIYALQRQQKQRGVAALCIGGGEATAIALELVSGD